MRSVWSEREAKDTVDHYAKAGIAPDLGMRVYSTRLLGRDPTLVLHGGGNTSVKTRLPDLTGAETDVLCVKGSGWDMGTIEPAGLPAVRLDALRKLRARDALDDDAMVQLQRANLIDPSSPNPSVETLLHAFLPAKFVDHTHSSAVLSLIDQPDSKTLCDEVYDGRIGFVPYVMPGFALAKAAAEVFDSKPNVIGLILDKHGIFSFGDDARQSYERMIELVTRAEERIARGRNSVFAAAALPPEIALPSDVAPILRGACAIGKNGTFRRFVMDLRVSDAILNFVNGKELGRYSQAGVVTPDHTIRTKNQPLIAAAPRAGQLDEFRRLATLAADEFVSRYEDYFARQNARTGGGRTMLDPAPRVIVVPGVGLFGLGRSAKEAGVAADIAEAAVEAISGAEAIGRFTPIDENDMFDVEYWPLEQAKLRKVSERPLAGQIAVITGGGGAIGAATAAAFAAAGAAIALLDIDLGAAQNAAKTIGGGALAVACDVTDDASVTEAFAQVIRRFGGLDILVSNAGAAWQGRIGEVDDGVLRKSFELNFFAHQKVAQAAVAVMRKQGTGGCLLFNVSKQAVNPGPDFGPYGLPKAATLALMRQYAVDYGRDGIRANAVNADRIRSGLLTGDFIQQRAKARQVSEQEYMSGNLLGLEVTADDVAQAFLSQALAEKTTGNVVTVDGGNIAAALR